jgi:hypothetical protein
MTKEHLIKKVLQEIRVDSLNQPQEGYCKQILAKAEAIDRFNFD